MFLILVILIKIHRVIVKLLIDAQDSVKIVLFWLESID